MYDRPRDPFDERQVNFWIRRLAHAGITLAAVSLLAFSFLSLAPGDFVDQLRLDPRISEETLDAMRARFGLDRPFVQRYLGWASGVIDGSWGFSFAYGTDVAPLIRSRLLNTLLLGVSATALAWMCALPIGVYWALRRGVGSRWLGLVTSVAVAVPELVLALTALVVASATGWFPVGGMVTLGADELPFLARLRDLLSHLVLPVAVVSIPTAAVLARHVRSAVEQVLEDNQVLAARSLGLRSGTLLLHHLLRPAANPLIAVASLSVASLLSGSFIVEVVMGWPGLGPLLLDAIRARDLHVVIGGVMCSAALVVAGRLVGDIALYLNDPRITAR